MTVIRFVVGSLNPIKLEAVRNGVGQIFEEVEVRAIAAPSGVSAQPFGDEEMISGATQRARAVLKLDADANFGVGLEGGVLELKEGLFACAWCAIANRDGAIGVASTGRFELPATVANLVRSGFELGDADDQVFGRSNSKQQEGAVGILTHGRLSRAQFYTPAVLLALVRFVNQEHYA